LGTRFQRLGLLALLAVAGCFSPERDNPQDPYNTPILQVLDAAYEPETGTVHVRWEFLGAHRVEAFKVLRKVDAGFEAIARIDGSDATESGWTAASFRDTAVVAGEVLQYIVSAEGSGGGLASSDPVPVTVAGAKMTAASPDLAGGSVRVFWRPQQGAGATYEVVRETQDLQEQVIYSTHDETVSTFVDEGPRGDVPHTYWIRTVMPNGVQVESRREDAQLYQLRADLNLAGLSLAEGRLLLYEYPPGATSHGVLLTRSVGGAAETQWMIVHTQTYRYLNNVPSAIMQAQRINTGALAVSSLSVAGPSPQQGPLGVIKAFVAGVDSQSGLVTLGAYGASEEPIYSESWVAPGASQTASCMTEWGILLVSAGGHLRAFDGFLDAGSAAIPGEPDDLVASGPNSQILWAAYPSEGRLLRGEMDLGGGRLLGVTWADVDLPTGAQPVSLVAYDYEQVFVLDGVGRVLVYSGDGHRLSHWPLPGMDWARGSISTDSRYRSLVHVLDGGGRILTYEP